MERNSMSTQDRSLELNAYGLARDGESPGASFLDLLPIWTSRWRSLIGVSCLVGVIAWGLTYLIAPTFTAKTTFLAPQQQQSATAAAVASLGALSGLAGLGNMKSPADQYISLMQSNNVRDRVIDRFELMKRYGARYRAEARAGLEAATRITLGKKDGIITIEADADDPKLAADLANQHVEELRRLSGELALTEAQQRRHLFEKELQRTREKLTQAQIALQGSGFNSGALKAEPKAAAENYGRVKAQATAAEIKLQAMRGTLSDSAVEVQQQVTIVAALQAQVRTLEASTSLGEDADYVSKYREFKYQETLFDLFARQYEVARVEEGRDGTLVQVIDAATPPERKSKPRRLLIASGVGVLTFVAMLGWIYIRHSRALSQRLKESAPLPEGPHSTPSSGIA